MRREVQTKKHQIRRLLPRKLETIIWNSAVGSRDVSTKGINHADAILNGDAYGFQLQ